MGFFIDNWYTSPALLEKLHYRRTGVCGTVRTNRVGLPTFPSKLLKGEQTFQHKCDVHMLYTAHVPNTVLTDKVDRATNEPIAKTPSHRRLQRKDGLTG